jgi:hypothetical protein
MHATGMSTIVDPLQPGDLIACLRAYRHGGQATTGMRIAVMCGWTGSLGQASAVRADVETALAPWLKALPGAVTATVGTLITAGDGQRRLSLDPVPIFDPGHGDTTCSILVMVRTWVANVPQAQFAGMIDDAQRACPIAQLATDRELKSLLDQIDLGMDPESPPARSPKSWTWMRSPIFWCPLVLVGIDTLMWGGQEGVIGGGAGHQFFSSYVDEVDGFAFDFAIEFRDKVSPTVFQVIWYLWAVVIWAMAGVILGTIVSVIRALARSTSSHGPTTDE